MATRSIIAIQDRTTGTFRSIYVHWNGDKHGDTLRAHYATAAKRRALLALGDLSMLAASTEAPAGHTFDYGMPGHCVAYGRDRGEKGTAAQRHATLDDVLQRARDCWAEYVHVYRGGQWERLDVDA